LFGTFTRFYLRKRLSRKRNWKQRSDALIREGRPDEAEARLKVFRIDFLKGHDGICFTEFCSAPGGFEQFDAESGLRPGGLYLRAEIRLQNDLPGGKAFDHFARLDN